MNDSHYERIGGDASVRKLVDRFYDLMDELPEARPLRDMHPPELAGSRDKLHWFLVGWLGGPQLYVERFGHPRLRARHMPFAVDDAARDQWMLCMRRALDQVVEDALLREVLAGSIGKVADHMRNR